MKCARYLNRACAEIVDILCELGLNVELFRRLANIRRIGQRKKHHFLAGDQC